MSQDAQMQLKPKVTLFFFNVSFVPVFRSKLGYLKAAQTQYYYNKEPENGF